MTFAGDDWEWVERPRRGPEPERMAGALRIHPVTAEVMATRDLGSPEAAESYWQPRLRSLVDPRQMADMEKAAGRIVRAIEAGEPIVVWGDYDVDGSTSVSLLLRFFRLLKARASFHIPLRLRDGYGLNAGGLAKLAQDGARVVITVDNGISARAEALEARRLGLDLIITDHHECPAELPSAFAVVNPRRSDCPYPDKRLAGVGVAYKLCHAVALMMPQGRVPSDIKDWLLRSLQLVALGTIADMVPLVGENRVLALHGLAQLSSSPFEGLKALLAVAKAGPEVSSTDISFKLAPRINAAGRLSTADTGVRLMTTEDPLEARELSLKLDRANTERREIEKEQAREAMAQLDTLIAEGDRLVAASSPGWHPGVIGIVAQRLVEKYHLPAVVVAVGDGTAKGSCRSIEGFHIQSALTEVSDLLSSFGGHAMAAGFSLKPANLPLFFEKLKEVACRRLPDQPRRRVSIDAWLGSLSEVGAPLMNELARLAPFGSGNPVPQLAARSATMTEVRPLGRDGHHLSMSLASAPNAFRAVAFQAGHLYETLKPGGRYDVVFSPRWNDWSGDPRIELDIKALRRAPAA
ncbi:MAG: single-stranded-DNA-specific exonuclease RecJ [Planctomycetota bacterium]